MKRFKEIKISVYGNAQAKLLIVDTADALGVAFGDSPTLCWIIKALVVDKQVVGDVDLHSASVVRKDASHGHCL